MSSNTKIYVINQKKLICVSAIVIIAIIAIIIWAVAGSNNNDKAVRTSYSSTETKSATSTSSEIKYTPGVYTASTTLDGTPVNVIVTVDENNINSIQLSYTSDAITTMYPMLEDNFNELADNIIANGSTANISYNTDNKYTTTILLKAISQAMDKCIIKE